MGIRFALFVLIFGSLAGLDAANSRRAYNRNQTFACGDSNRRIPISWKCDGDIDCAKGEDEADCNKHCSDQEFQCLGEQKRPDFKPEAPSCIPKDWVCDGEYDCDDRSDERNCQNLTCHADQFACSEFDGNYKLCIPLTWKCDGQRDCASGADEENCEENHCQDNDFTCDNGICIFKSWVCDAEDDCGDGSDEKNCNKTAEQICNEKNLFKCKAAEGCIPSDWKCDGEADCLDHSDERNCSHVQFTCKRPETQFACASGHLCINSLWRCDFEPDCPDGSDEVGCEGVRDCLADEYKCSNSVCISKGSVCDGRQDCMLGEDEENCPGNDTVVSCDKHLEYDCGDSKSDKHICVKLKDMCKDGKHNCGMDDDICFHDILTCKPGSDNCDCHDSYFKSNNTKTKVCYCRNGYRSDDATPTSLCRDINECEEEGVCDQMCHNIAGGFMCSCRHGYKLSHGANSSVATRCRAIGGDPLVLLSNRATIRQFDLVTNVHVPLIQSVGSAVAMDFHHSNGTIIWSDITLQKIFMCKIGNDTVNQHLAIKQDCDGDKSVLVEGGIQTPDGLAIDWVHNLLFWTDGGLDQINVMDLQNKKKRVLFSSELEEPRAIAVDPEMGLIFWTDWGKEARIERAGMDGQHRTVIVRGDRVKWPNGLALDYIAKRVYWADAKVKSIFSCDYWGENIKVVLHSHQYLRHPFSLAVFEDRVYYTDWEHDGVITLNKFTGSDVRKVMNKVATPMTVRIYHKEAQPMVENKCSANDCEEMCLPRAVYRGNTKGAERTWNGRPYACLCQGNTPADMLECAVQIASDTTTGGSSSRTLILLLSLAFVSCILIMVYVRDRKSRPFAPLNFDNPIYRRTVEAETDDRFRNPFDDDVPTESHHSNKVMVDPEVDTHNSMVQIESSLDKPLTT
ncbi:unnamed protein product [Auanema sp. JU1783]|nr:unnamed protein product [Auanema sp. JU1783]